MSERRQRDARSVDPQLEPPSHGFHVSAGADLVARLEGRNLGEVEDVADEHAVARELDARIVVHGEVAERVRGGSARPTYRRDERDEHGRSNRGNASHVKAFRATGAQWTEKFGFRAIAFPYQRRMAARSPAHPAA
jgi:hypothetical protein